MAPPTASPSPNPTASPAPTASPNPTASPAPTASPRPTASPARTAEPRRTAKPISTATISDAPQPVAGTNDVEMLGQGNLSQPDRTESAPARTLLPAAKPRTAATIPTIPTSTPEAPRAAPETANLTAETDQRPAATEAQSPTSLPALLEIQLGDTLAAMATRVYGRQSYTLLDLIQAANPGLDDPSRIIAGGIVLFPSLDSATRIVSGPDGQLQVIALTTPSLRQALARQSQLQKEMARPVEIETVSLYDGPDLYRVFLPAFASPDDALRTAQAIGPVLKK